MKALYTASIISAMMLNTFVASAQEEKDSLIIAQGDEITMSTQYTISLKNIKFKTQEGEMTLKVRSASNGRGGNITFTPNQIIYEAGDKKTVIADNLIDGMEAHDYTITRLATIRVFRDGTQIAAVSDNTYRNETPRVVVLGAENLDEGYQITIDSQEKNIAPDIAQYENNIGNMLTEFDNLAEDPYCNKGFITTGDGASERKFSTYDAVYGGWGSEAYMDNEDAYSGKYSIRLEGQASWSEEGTTGASLEQNIEMTSQKPYLIRAMVKSNGYEGKIGIEGENAFIHITDTKGEWKQVEGLLIPGSNRTNLYINNADFVNNGTLRIDNFEVYEGYSNTSIGLKSSVPSVSVPAGTKWSPNKNVNVYMLGLTDNGSSYSQIDTAKVKVTGGAYLTKNVEGSQMYSMYFPGDLNGMTVTGSFDGNSYNEEPLYNGVDYILQRFDYPYFKYIDEKETITNGCYLVQFVDNLDGLNVKMFFGKEKSGTEQEGEYTFTGNPIFADYSPEKKFYKFNESNQRFELTEGVSIKPFEAYIATTASQPVSNFTPDGSTGIQRLNGTDGSRMSIIPINGGIEINAIKKSVVSIYSITGQKIAIERINQGRNTINLAPGIYIVGGKKVAVK